jgi:hypothetical protein
VDMYRDCGLHKMNQTPWTNTTLVLRCLDIFSSCHGVATTLSDRGYACFAVGAKTKTLYALGAYALGARDPGAVSRDFQSRSAAQQLLLRRAGPPTMACRHAFHLPAVSSSIPPSEFSDAQRDDAERQEWETRCDYVSRSVPSSAGQRFSKSPSRWSPRFNRASIRCCVSGHVSAV